jgi:ABC-2 type transport system ATP-binding protein
MDTVISVEHLRKTYGPVVAVDDVSFDVRRGEIFGILGSNGAGKTTTVEILQGLRGLTGGRVEVLGLDPGRETEQLRRRIGSQLQSAALPDRLRVVEAIRLFGRLHEKPVNVDGTIEAWKLERLGNRPFGVLFRRRAAAAVRRPCPPRRPELVLLDELTTRP